MDLLIGRFSAVPWTVVLSDRSIGRFLSLRPLSWSMPAARIALTLRGILALPIVGLALSCAWRLGSLLTAAHSKDLAGSLLQRLLGLAGNL